MNLAGARVFCGLSGGVDSAVTPELLRQAGAQVTGVFIKGWYPEGMPCTWKEDRLDAMRVAAHLGIPFATLDASSEYKKGVIDYLISEYAQGRTPNPDVMCNREVKFGAFYEFANKHGANYIATGHYAQTKDGKLFRGVDESKDQSYFLWAVPADALTKTLFPLGAQRKEHVRVIAQKLKLPNAAKKDSQGICFLGSISVEDFLIKELGTERGVAIDEKGNEIGSHSGAVLHTLGERVSLEHAAPGPWYVIKKDLRTNTLTVSHTKFAPKELKTVTLTESNWFSRPEPNEAVTAQYRYHGPRIAGSLDETGTVFTPKEPFPEALAAGQSLVIYRNEECMGGGIMA